MKQVVIFLATVTAVSSAPQGVVLGTLTPEGRNPFDSASPVDIWKHFFNRESFPLIPRHPVFPSFSSQPEFPGTSGIPADLGDLPDGYTNSTHEVKEINGSRFEVNQTVTKNSEGGVIYSKVVVQVSSGGDHLPNGTLHEGDMHSARNPFHSHFGFLGQVPSTTLLDRQRRGLLEWFKKSISRIRGDSNTKSAVSDEKSTSKAPSNDDHATEFTKSNPQASSLPVPGEERRNDIAYVGDTDVNYVGVQPRDNPDAEVFDINLVREDADKFFARRPQPIRSQPMRSQPIMSQPLRSLPIRSQPVRPQPTNQ